MLAKTPRSNAAVANMEAALCLAILSVLRSSPCVFKRLLYLLVPVLTRLSKNSVLVIAS
jgi:hypothetical protein